MRSDDQLPVLPQQKGDFGWYARRVRAEGEDAWVKMSGDEDPTTGVAAKPNWDLNWKCVSPAPECSQEKPGPGGSSPPDICSGETNKILLIN